MLLLLLLRRRRRLLQKPSMKHQTGTMLGVQLAAVVVGVPGVAFLGQLLARQAWLC